MKNRTGNGFRTLLIAALIGIAAIHAYGQDPDTLSLSIPPGTYAENLVVSSTLAEGLDYRFVTPEGIPHTAFFLPLDGVLFLEAPRGGRSRFDIEFRRRSGADDARTVTYHIDRASPSVPTPDILPGVYDSPVTITVEGIDPGEVPVIHYALQTRGGAGTASGDFGPLAEGGTIELPGSPGRITDYTVVAYAADSVGNRSGIGQWLYRIDRRAETARTSPVILSPVAGTFANEQLLYLDTTGLTDIRVTVERSGSTSDKPYDGPETIPGQGTIHLSVSAVARLDGTAVEEQVTWTQDDVSLPVSPGGRYTDGVGVFPRFESGTPRYNLNDTIVGTRDDLLLQPIRLEASVDTLRFVPLRFRLTGERNTGEWRYSYVLDGRRAPAPTAAFFDDRLILFALSDNEISYRPLGVDGTLLVDEFVSYSEPIDVRALPAGTRSIESRARYNGSRWGASRTVAIPAHSTPSLGTGEDSVYPVGLQQRGEVVRITPGSGGRVFLYDANRDGVSEHSPVMSGRFSASVEWRLPRGYRLNVAGTEQLLPSGALPETLSVVTIDNAPPEPPEIVISERRFRIETKPETVVMYRVDAGAFEPYGGRWIRLEGQPGGRVDRVVEAYAVVGSEASPRIRRTVTIDNRPVTMPPLVDGDSGSDEEILTNTSPYVLQFANPHRDFRLYYEVSSGAPPPLPTDESPSALRDISIESEGTGDQVYFVRVRGRFVGRDEWSPIRMFRISVDRTPPEVPVLQAPEPSVTVARSSLAVEFRQPTEDGVTLWYRTRPDAKFEPYNGRFTVFHDGGSESALIEAYTEDRSGNRSYLQEPARIRFVTTGVPQPRLTLNGQPISRNRVLLSRETLIGVATGSAATRIETRWRVYPLTETVRPEFAPYAEEFLAAVAEQSVAYVAEAYSIDPVTAEESAVTRVTLVIDAAIAATVPEPFVLRDASGNTGTVIWSGARDQELYASRRLSSGSEGTDFQPVFEALTWSIPEAEESLIVNYFVIDSVGRRSETRSLTIPRIATVSPPRLEGVTDGGIYSAEQVVELSGAGEIRYTLSTDGGEPPPVHPLSTRYDGPIVLSASRGEDQTYRLRAAIFDETGDSMSESLFTVRIDRALPAPPELTGVISGTFYPDTTTVRFGERRDATVYYRLLRGDTPPNTQFLRYQGDGIELMAETGELSRYEIEAYTVDGAGNRSQSVARWEMYVDREVVYVAATDTGGSERSGTRTDPALDGNAALRIAQLTGRRTLFLGEGRHTFDAALLNDTISNIPDLAIVGGFTGDDWRKGAGESVIAVTGSDTIELNHAAQLRDLTIDPSFVQIVSIGDRNVIETVVAAGSTSVIHRSGELTLRDVTMPEVVVESVQTGIGNPILIITESTIGQLRAASGSVSMERSTVGQIAMQRATATISDSTVQRVDEFPWIGDRAGIAVTNGDLTLRRSTIWRDSHGGTDPVVSVTGGTIAIDSSVVQGRSTEGPLVLLRGTDSRLDLQDSYLSGFGGLYTYGVVARGGSLSVDNSLVAVTGGSDQVGFVLAETSSRFSGGAVINVATGANLARGVQITGRRISDARFDEVLFLRLGEDPQVQRSGSTSALDRQSSRSRSAVTEAAIRTDATAVVDTSRIAVAGWARGRATGPTAMEWESSGTAAAMQERVVKAEELPLILRTPRFDPVSWEDIADVANVVREAIARVFDQGETAR